MKLKISLLGLLAAALSFGQFGGILNRAKQKVEDAQRAAKPVTDRAQKAADTYAPWTDAEEEEIGTASATKLVAIFGTVDDPAIVRYVNLTGQAVAQFSSRPLRYRFGVLDTDIVGAYALPGGYIFITRGALSGIANEAQLAGLLGHEIVHAAERHLEREIRSANASAWVIEEGKSVGNSSDLSTLRADAFVKDLFTTKLSREKEASADRQGSALAAQAGYHPAGLLQVLTAMAAAATTPEGRRMFGQLLSTHPPFEARIAALRPEVEALGPGTTLEERFRATFVER